MCVCVCVPEAICILFIFPRGSYRHESSVFFFNLHLHLQELFCIHSIVNNSPKQKQPEYWLQPEFPTERRLGRPMSAMSTALPRSSASWMRRAMALAVWRSWVAVGGLWEGLLDLHIAHKDICSHGSFYMVPFPCLLQMHSDLKILGLDFPSTPPPRIPVAKWRFIGFPTKNVIILVVTGILGGG